MTSIFTDLRYGLRALRRDPGFAAVVLLTLALGIGATTAIFSVVNTVFLRALPFPESDRLVRIRNYSLGTGGDRNRYGVTPRNLDTLIEQSKSLKAVVGLYAMSAAVTGGESPERVRVVGVSSGWAPVLGVRPSAGRLFSDAEQREGQASHVAIVSGGLAARRFGGDAKALGQEIVLDEQRYSIVGVMPGRFAFPYGADVWVPRVFDPNEGRGGSIAVFGRLADGVALEAVRAEIETIADRLESGFPDTNHGVGFDAEPARVSFMNGQDRIVIALLAAVGFLLLMACANVANLLLARGVARERELAVRTALGARRARQVRQLLTESVVLAVGGGVIGLLFSAWLGGSLASLVPNVLHAELDLSGAGLDGRVLGFALAVAVTTGIVFGLVPAWSATRGDVHDLLREGARAGGSTRGRRLLGAFVLSEIALAVALLVGAGTMVVNFDRLRQRDLGIDTDRLVTMRVSLEDRRYADGARRTAFVAGALEALRATPGIVAAGLTTVNPLCCGDWGARVSIEGQPTGPDDPPRVVAHQYVMPGTFEAMGIRLVAGRDFTDRDRAGAQPVIVVDERFAKRYFPGVDPIGKRVKRGQMADQVPWLTVVGVVGAVRDSSDYTESWYVPYLLSPLGPSAEDLHFMVRLSSATPELVKAAERAVHQADPAAAIFETTTMAALEAERLSPDRIGALVGALLGTFGLVLSALGVYGVVAFGVSRRRREIGVRLALGAAPRQVLLMVLRQGLMLALPGVAAGAAGAYVLSRLFGAMVFGVSAPGPGIYLAVTATLTLVAITATLVPARRATRIDPIEALREE